VPFFSTVASRGGVRCCAPEIWGVAVWAAPSAASVNTVAAARAHILVITDLRAYTHIQIGIDSPKGPLIIASLFISSAMC
jgi:hypothetical protein